MTVPPPADFEARFFAALAALASLVVHAVVVLWFLTGAVDVPRPPPLLVEIVREPATAPAAAVDALPAGADEPGLPLARSSDGSDVLDGDDSLPRPDDALDAPTTGYRERLRRRERAFARDMAVRRARAAALERFLTERGAATPASVDGEAVFLCGASDAGQPVVVRAARSMERYADLTPVGLFPPRYLDEVTQVAREGDALGRIELALPPREVIVQLDEPRDAVFAVGRRDARCLVGFSWGRDVFPLRFRGLPARYVDADDTVRELVMDVVLHVDATFEVTVVSGDALPFTRGALYDRDAVARNLEQRATGARVVRDFLGALLGG